MMDMHIVDDDIAYVLQSNASSARNVNISSSPINSLVAIKDELLIKLDEHVAREHNPQWFRLYHGVSQSPRLWIHGIIVGRVSNNVVLPTFASKSILTKPDCAVR